MARDFCPRCRDVTNMRLVDRMLGEAGPEGFRLIMRRSAHCATCGTFVSATEAPVPTTVITGSD